MCPAGTSPRLTQPSRPGATTRDCIGSTAANLSRDDSDIASRNAKTTVNSDECLFWLGVRGGAGLNDLWVSGTGRCGVMVPRCWERAARRGVRRALKVEAHATDPVAAG